MAACQANGQFLPKKATNLSDYFIVVNPFENVEHTFSLA